MSELTENLVPQPTSRMCFVCGRENPAGLHAHFYEDRENQQVLVNITLPEKFQGYPGITHGGIVASILDEVSGRAIMVGKDDAPFWVTAKLEVRYRMPTPTQTPLTVVGWVVKERRRSAEVAGEIRLEDGTVTAEVSAVVVRPNADTLQEWEQEQQFWRVE